MKKTIALIVSLLTVACIVISLNTNDVESSEIPVFKENNSIDMISTIESDIRFAEQAALRAATSSDALNSGYLVVTDYLKADGKNDVSDIIQDLIDNNPNRTIYFPDGVYLIGKSIFTPADPKKSVDLQLSNYAVIRASQDFSGEALIRLGGKDAANDTHTAGSNYSLTGGVIDACGKSNGVSIDSGRETVISKTSIKNAVIGIHVKYGANSGSSDADISDVNIIGTGSTDSVGILVEGFDNTFTNIRIGNVFIGVHLKSASNSLRNIHPLYYSDYTDYENSCGFFDECGSNIYDFCYSDQFCVGFRTVNGVSSIYDNCFCFWYSATGGREIAFKADGGFNSVSSNFRCGFRGDTENSVLVTDKNKGRGIFDNLLYYSNDVSDFAHKKYTEGTFLNIINRLFS
ncbi:MAG: hypothetical protein IJE48_09100 [Clostridia bacterium]|nr:hypothetical protein [Clostridia bacterium]